MNKQEVVKKHTYAGLFMVTLATLMYEILLTRIFSVTMWYHFAFMAVSVAMFGMTVGAILVYLLPNYFTQKRAKYHLALSSLLFGLSIVVCFLIYLNTPLVTNTMIGGLFSSAFIYVIISVPFMFSGICVCLALTKFPRQVSKLYAFDLAGAAVGCIVLIYTLKVTDGPTAVVLAGLFAIFGGVFFAVEVNKRLAILFSFIILVFGITVTGVMSRQLPALKLKWVKGRIERPPLYEKWNSFSRVTVRAETFLANPFSWSPSSVTPSKRKVKQLWMQIDSQAGTPLTAFDGDLSDLEYLKYDLTNLVHYIRPNSKVLVIGSGGGRDILSALVFNQRFALGVEMNKDIIDAVNQRFGDFTGHLDKHPKVTFVNDEARSYIARQRDQFDIIQVSLIDTWAATAAGAFALTENSLYTMEAWKLFLEKLTPDGVLTFTRYYFRDCPGETYRLTSLASASLRELGIENPRSHIIVVRNLRHHWRRMPNNPDGYGTILLSKKPFSDEDLQMVDRICQLMQFDLVISPNYSLDSTFATIASGVNLEGFAARFPINISPPTDDSPFFFHMLRLQDIFNRELWEQGALSFNMKAVSILGTLLIVVMVLTFLCIIVPLIIKTKRTALRGAPPLCVFFAAIGFGFMLVEISQMQRLIIFLGHPTYGLSVVLFSLLLSSGLGSYSTHRIGDHDVRIPAIKRLFALLCALVLFGKLTPYAMSVFQGSITMVRILVAIGILFPLGLFMGMAFPLGMKIASNKSVSLTPWLWGINGATSVCASVLAVVIALSSSISTAFWMGFFCYAVSFIIFVWTTRKEPSDLATGQQYVNHELISERSR
ncbi:MAG: hypothetical protein AMJ90_05180 [candidate division Zixibacteria bacterium SM23_73_2]|nr:MAG: hypothetical protein AMJ90_05180 [candidate division Zixibacteria bacterium SM23_73_2]